MWLKIKVWTKVIIASALILYALIFIFQNSAKPVTFWWWIGREQPASVFTLSGLAFLSGMIAAVLIRTTWKTYSQVRELQRRSRQQRMERELTDMKSKAGMLKTRQPGQPASAVSAPAASAPPEIDDLDDTLPS